MKKSIQGHKVFLFFIVVACTAAFSFAQESHEVKEQHKNSVVELVKKIKHTTKEVGQLTSSAYQISKEEGRHFAQEAQELWIKAKETTEKAGKKIKDAAKNLGTKMQKSFHKMANRFRTEKQIILITPPEEVAEAHGRVLFSIEIDPKHVKNVTSLMLLETELETFVQNQQEKSKNDKYHLVELMYRTVRDALLQNVVKEFSIDFLKKDFETVITSEINKIEDAERTILHLYIQSNEDAALWASLVERIMNIARMVELAQEEHSVDSFYNILDAIHSVISDAIEHNSAIYLHMLSNMSQSQDAELVVESL